MVRNGVSVPIHWHVFVQVGPRRVLLLPWWWFMVIAGLAPPIRKGEGEQVGVLHRPLKSMQLRVLRPHR